MESFDPDHALAILLQARFNEEAKKETKNNKENLPVSLKRPLPQASLTDPEWETTDPCPDIHGLFLAFNDRFFWGRLLSVEVKWSHQMTSCAGICVYEGRNGLCSVRLSAPLLKLRPRSDLIETLLHEMIHAYLFVTNNNRDREGHGPEFHKHMYRINKEAGTNITVYHSFHAEVKMYQQHWWRCNGPCHLRPPFFGMVKRAKNRVPGPNDLWWADHQATCGGQFVKVREPENYKSKKQPKGKKAPVSQQEKDIRSFFKTPTNGSATVTSSQIGKNIFGFNNFHEKSASSSNNQPTTGVGSQVNRVTGFKDLTSSNVSSKPSGGRGHVLGSGTPSSVRGRPGGRGGMLANKGGGTLVVTGSKGKKEVVDKPESPNTKLRIDNFKVFSGSGFTLGGSSSNPDRYRSRLLNEDNGHEEKKRKSHSLPDSNSPKNDDSDEPCRCVICNKSMPREEIDEHLEICTGLKNVFNNTSSVDETEMSSLNKKYEITSCPVCSVHFKGDINDHLDECLNNSGIFNIVDEPPIEISDSESPAKTFKNSVPKPEFDNNIDVEIIESENRVACPICGMRFGESRINEHVNQCIDSD